MRVNTKKSSVSMATLIACAVLLLGMLPWLTGCAYVFVPYPHTSVRFDPVSGRVLDEHTQAPIAGAKVFLTHHPEVACKSDRAGTFKLKKIRNWHAGEIGVPAGASDWPSGQYWDPDITVSHTNYAPCEVAWRYHPSDIILLKKLESSR
jgi:hypothetical protein